MIRKIQMFIVWKLLPKKIIALCGYRIGAYVTSGIYSNQGVPALSFIDAMGRYEKLIK